MTVFWDVAPFSLVIDDSEVLIAPIMKAVSTSETLVYIYQTSRRNISEDSHRHFRTCMFEATLSVHSYNTYHFVGPSLGSPAVVRHERCYNAPQRPCSDITDNFAAEEQQHTSSTQQQCAQDHHEALRKDAKPKTHSCGPATAGKLNWA
jgi:hypothetical protein